MKKRILCISGVISLMMLAVEYIGTYFLCDYFFINGHRGNCPFILSDVDLAFFPIIPLFIFSLIAYKLKEEIFQTWWKFSRVWIPASMLAILIAPSYSNNWIFPVEKGTVASSSSIIYALASLGIIVYQFLNKKK